MPEMDRYGLRTKERKEKSAEVVAQAAQLGLELIRFSFVDQHGLLRGKTMVVSELASILDNGCGAPSSLLAKDTSHRTVFPVFSEGAGLDLVQMQGAADMTMLPDPFTFRVLPWAAKTGWLLCDLYFLDGRPAPFCTRGLYGKALRKAADAGWSYMAGAELEFHLFRIKDEKLALEDAGQPGTPPEVLLTTQGYRYLTEDQFDRLEPVLDQIRQGVQGLGLPLRSLEIEFGPSQCEVTLSPLSGLAAADAVVLLRSAIRQIARRLGYHATFMCRPRIPNVISSGWHLHQSLIDGSGRGLFPSANDQELLSPEGHSYLAGLLAHAREGALFAAPTINAYRRYRPNSLAPDRANWGRDNRGAMLRVIGGGRDPATHFENRIGEPAANPYLYMSSQLLAGLDGIERRLDPGPASGSPYGSDAPFLPRSLAEAVATARGSQFFQECFGKNFLDYYCMIKEYEIARYEAEVSEWEHREYFDTF